MDEREVKQQSKVVVLARKWVRSRRAKSLANESERRRAESRHRQDGNELAEAVERLEKGWSDAPPRAGPGDRAT